MKKCCSIVLIILIIAIGGLYIYQNYYKNVYNSNEVIAVIDYMDIKMGPSYIYKISVDSGYNVLKEKTSSGTAIDSKITYDKANMKINKEDKEKLKILLNKLQRESANQVFNDEKYNNDPFVVTFSDKKITICLYGTDNYETLQNIFIY